MMGAMLSLLAVGCSQEDLEVPGLDNGAWDGDTQLVINLAVPKTVQAGSGTRADVEMTPDDDECKINSLRFIAFSNNGTPCVNRPLMVPDKMPVNPDRTATYEIGGIERGDYKIYVVANLEDYVKDVTTEEALKQIIMNLNGSNELKAGNLPMVYDPADGTVSIPAGEQTNPTVANLSMEFACVKVRYNLLFDNTSFSQQVFGTNGLVIKNMNATDVSKKAYLVPNSKAIADNSLSKAVGGLHYTSYTETPGNASVRDKNVINVSGTGAARPSATGKWAYQGTIYLPERYNSTQTTLNIDAQLTTPQGNDGTVKCKYKIALGAHDGDKNNKDLNRGDYYEIIARIKSLGDADLETQIVRKNWMETVLSADMVHTYLKVNKTEGSVTSLENDFITYDTDGRGDIKFTCDTKLGTGYSAIIPAYDYANKRVTFMVNPDIDITNTTTFPVSQRKGTAKCWLEAGNIRKQINVDYDITPFFTIKPLDLKIQWNETYDGAKNVRVYEYRTNMGGIDITSYSENATGTVRIGGTGNVKSYTDQVAKSRIQMTCTDPSKPTGVIKVELLGDPETTTVHYFTAVPRKDAGTGNTKKDKMKQLTVTTMPPLGPYRIYFRPINDWVPYDNGGVQATAGEFLNGSYSNYPAEDYGTDGTNSKNWTNWWGDDNFIYIYTQMGETTGTPTPGSWLFTGGYDDCQAPLTRDNTNPGWYFYNLDQHKKSSWHEGSQKEPEPGKTLMIFYAHNNGGFGYEVHRAAHHLDPGIPLFDFEDREGYVLYDPTTEPYYKIYDSKPYIEDVTYTVYSKEKITKWYNKYGVAENNVSFNDPKQWEVHYTIKSADQSYNNGWYKTTIKLKAPRGDYEKAIKLVGIGPTVSMKYSRPIPAGAIRIYYRSDNWGNDVPKIYVYNGNKKNADWGSTPSMSLERISGGNKYYYYDIYDSDLKNGYVIFQTADRQGQYPGQNQGGLSIEGSTKMFGPGYSWSTYLESSLPTPDTSKADAVLFGGRSFPGHVGTFENGKWRAGAPQ